MDADQIAELLTPEDVRLAAYGTEVPEGESFDNALEHLIGKAARELLRDVAPNRLQRRLDRGLISTVDIKDVLESMVVRVVRNPSGYRQFGIDDFQATMDEALSTGMLYVSVKERQSLLGRRTRNFGSIRTRIPDWRMPHV